MHRNSGQKPNSFTFILMIYWWLEIFFEKSELFCFRPQCVGNNASLHDQRGITSSALDYIIKATLHDQRCIVSSTLDYISNGILNDQWHIRPSIAHYTINVALHSHRDAFYRQGLITS